MTSIAIDRRDGLSAAVAVKGPCRVATTANITLEGLQTIDGVVLAADDRVLVKDQTDASENGIYVADTGTWARAKDFSRSRDVVNGTFVLIVGGTGAGLYSLTTADPVNVGDDDLTFALAPFQPVDADLTLLAALTTTAFGRALLEDASAADTRDALDAAPYVATRTALKALDTTKDTVAILTESGREGVFKWTTGNFASLITADTQEGVYVKADAIAAASGAWVRQFDGPADVGWFGAAFSTGTDDDAAFTCALAVASAASPKLALTWTGTMEVSGSYTVPSQVHILGQNRFVTKIATSSATNTVLTAGSSVKIKGLGFTATVTRSNGAIYLLSNAGDFFLEDFRMDNAATGIKLEGNGPWRRIKNGRINGLIATNGIGIHYDQDPATGNSISDVIITDAGNGGKACIWIDQAGDLTLTDVTTVGCTDGVRIAPGTGAHQYGFKATNCWFDAALTNGIFIVPSGEGEVLRCDFTACWFGNPGSNGVHISGSSLTTGKLDGLHFVNCEFPGGGSAGVRVTGAAIVENIVVEACRIAGCTTFGIIYDNIVSGMIVGNRIGDAAGKGVNGTGVRLAGTSDNVLVSDNDLRDNTTNFVSTASGANNVVRGNVGMNDMVVSRQIVTVQGSAKALTNNITTAQSIFAAANDAITVKGSTTYRFRMRVMLNTGATSHTTAIGFGGTATFTDIAYQSRATSSAADTLATPQMRRVSAATAAVLTAASVAVTTEIEIEGIMRINAAGTIIPQVTFSAGPTGTCEVAVNSFIDLEPIGSDTIVKVADAT